MRRHPVIDLSATLIDPPAPGDIAAGIAERDAIDRSLERLTPISAIVVVLRFYRDLPVDEIAASRRRARRDRQVAPALARCATWAQRSGAGIPR